MNPYEELMNELYEKLTNKGYDCYFYLPDEKASYPFIFIDKQTSVDHKTKDRQLGESRLLFHVWGLVENRGLVSDMLLNVKRVAFEMQQTTNYRWSTNIVNEELFVDDITKDMLWHGVVEVNMNHY